MSKYLDVMLAILITVLVAFVVVVATTGCILVVKALL